MTSMQVGNVLHVVLCMCVRGCERVMGRIPEHYLLFAVTSLLVCQNGFADKSTFDGCMSHITATDGMCSQS